jgi:hypothetical protein
MGVRSQESGVRIAARGAGVGRAAGTRYATTILVRIFTLTVTIAAIVVGNERLPRFEDYPVTAIFKGTPAPPKLRPGDRLFRTRIREGAAKGPNFAGHYTIAEWGCGMGCVSIAIVDASDGRIYDAPFTALAWGMPLRAGGK